VHERHVRMLGLLRGQGLQNPDRMQRDLSRLVRYSRVRAKVQQLHWHVRILGTQVKLSLWRTRSRYPQPLRRFAVHAASAEHYGQEAKWRVGGHAQTEEEVAQAQEVALPS